MLPVPQKRSTSMIFRIDQLLPSTASTSSSTIEDAPKRHKNKQMRGVFTREYTPKDTYSVSVPTAELLKFDGSSEDVTSFHCALSDGVLLMPPTMVRQLKLSEDIYSFNALFELHAGQLRVRVVRDVAPNNELVAWFSEDLVLLMGIPFLTPLNIQGNNRYTCHLCSRTFETPHPLKIHLALSCGRSALDLLWIRLHYALKATRSSAAHDETVAQLTSAQVASSSTASSPTHSTPAVQRISAFRPIAATYPPPSNIESLMNMPATSQSSPLSYLPRIQMPGAPLVTMSATNPMNAAAQIEAIVSNMGASKQGHLCIYCGKVYSRKYGLKIHIRTHTGFKPLKCKFCLRPFGDPSNLNKHMRLHLHPSSSSGGGSSCVDGDTDSDASYQCQVCFKTLARRRDLQRHMETRHGDAPVEATATSPKDS